MQTPATPALSLVMSRKAVRVRSSALYLSRFAGETGEIEKAVILNHRPLTPLIYVAPWLGMVPKASSQGIRNTVFALYEPVLELPCCNVCEPNVVVKRSEERYTGADQDGNSSNG